MTTERKLLITTVTVSILALAGSWIWFIVASLQGGKAHIESPILASGGSTTFRVPRAKFWTCTSALSIVYSNVYKDCSAPYDTNLATKLSSQDLLQDPINVTGVPNDLNTPASATFFLRAPNGAPSTSGASIQLSAAAGTIHLHVADAGGSLAGLIPTYAEEPDASDTGQFGHAVQYYDVNCQVHGTPAAPLTTRVLACEHPGIVYWPNANSQYTCVHGVCQVFLTK